MTRRLLPPQEWPKLAGTELGELWRLLSPVQASVLVVEDGDQIVGCWAFLPVLHAEGVWIAPPQRKGTSVARHLIRGMRDVAASIGARAVWTGSADAQIDALLVHLGATEVPMKSFVIPMGKES